MHLRQVAKHKKVDPDQYITEEIIQAEFPEEFTYLWFTFYDLHKQRWTNGYAPLPLSWSDIGWWSYLRGIALDSLELELIIQLCNIFREEWGKGNAGSSGTDPQG